MRFAFNAVALGVGALATAPAVGHSKLLSADPAPNAAVAAPRRLQLAFSERLIAPFSGVDVTMTVMRGQKMSPPKKLSVKASLTGDRKTLVVTMTKALSQGTYRVNWHAVSTDTHRVQGSFLFTVK